MNKDYNFQNIIKVISKQPKPVIEKFRPVSCSIKESQYKKLELIAKKCNRGVSAFVKAVIEQIIKDSKL